MRSSPGFTVIEVLVAGAVSVILLLVVQACFLLVGDLTGASRGGVEARRGVRSLLLNLERDFRSASYVFTDFHEPALERQFDVSAEGTPGPELIFVAPETDEDAPRYTVCAVWLRPREPPDPLNPKAQEVVYYRKRGVEPPVPRAPRSIELDKLAGDEIRIFDAFVPPDGLQLEVLSGGNALRVTCLFRYHPPRGPVQEEVYRTLLGARNR